MPWGLKERLAPACRLDGENVQGQPIPLAHGTLEGAAPWSACEDNRPYVSTIQD